MTGRLRFQHLTAEPAKFRRIVNRGIRQFVLWDNFRPNSTNECGGFPIIVDGNCKMFGRILDYAAAGDAFPVSVARDLRRASLRASLEAVFS
jgi:hypothetical protein